MQVESAGELVPVEIRNSAKPLTPFQTEIMALNLVNQDDGLPKPCSGPVPATCPIPCRQGPVPRQHFLPSGNMSIVCRKLESKIRPSKSAVCQDHVSNRKGKERHRLRHRRHGIRQDHEPAAILDDINERRSVHIVTLEDPVEYSIPTRRHFNQRELGMDFDTYATACAPPCAKPKVILVGEMRDRETVEIV